MAEIDIEALRREAKGDGRECVPVSLRFVATALARVDDRVVLDVCADEGVPVSRRFLAAVLAQIEAQAA